MTHQQPNMTEQDLLTDLLNQEKHLMSLYAAGIQEASCKNLRKLLISQFNQVSQDQFEVFDQMREKGYYQTRDAPSQQVQQLKNAYKNIQADL
jgi:spore coat protein CotF